MVEVCTGFHGILGSNSQLVLRMETETIIYIRKFGLFLQVETEEQNCSLSQSYIGRLYITASLLV
jgi:hypothetical protein